MDAVKENLKLQLSELEMLQSAYCNPEEIQLDDYAIIVDIEDFIQGKTKILPQYLSFNVNLSVESVKFELSVTLPTDYPNVLPEVFVRVNEQNRLQQNKLNSDLRNYVSEIQLGDICVFSVVSWIQENLLNYIDAKTCTETADDLKQESFSRYWIYSHHIYNKMKRREILKLAEKYEITGFCLPGKPGIVCLEGNSNDCSSCWIDIKAMNWQKIVCKHTEESESNDVNFRKFDTFNEMIFSCENSKNKHMDMREFLTFLENHDCSHIFKELFGIDGKSANAPK